MIQLHPDCRTHLIDTIADAISSLAVTNGEVYWLLSWSQQTMSSPLVAKSGTYASYLMLALINQELDLFKMMRKPSPRPSNARP
jgi:hypothetical protein